jgi:hypothetical protein
MTATQLFYKTQLLLLLRLLLLMRLLRLLQLETDRSKDNRGGIRFKDSAAACRQLCKFRRRQLCKFPRHQLCKKTPDCG